VGEKGKGGLLLSHSLGKIVTKSRHLMRKGLDKLCSGKRGSSFSKEREWEKAGSSEYNQKERYHRRRISGRKSLFL